MAYSKAVPCRKRFLQAREYRPIGSKSTPASTCRTGAIGVSTPQYLCSCTADREFLVLGTVANEIDHVVAIGNALIPGDKV